jgi:hypothetical protein
MFSDEHINKNKQTYLYVTLSIWWSAHYRNRINEAILCCTQARQDVGISSVATSNTVWDPSVEEAVKHVDSEMDEPRSPHFTFTFHVFYTL